jgi:hypothetical protein
VAQGVVLCLLLLLGCGGGDKVQGISPVSDASPDYEPSQDGGGAADTADTSARQDVHDASIIGPDVVCEQRDCPVGHLCTGNGCVAVTPISIDAAPVPPAAVGRAYVARIQASGGAPPYTYTISVRPSDLTWMTLDPGSGALSGTPMAMRKTAEPFRVIVSDLTEQKASVSYDLTVFACVDGESVSCFAPLSLGAACGKGETVCEAGIPGTVCTGLTPTADLGHCGPTCGACDVTKANACSAGRCVCGGQEACGPNQACCGSGATAKCVDFTTDVANCGACAQSCPAGQHAQPVCLAGNCQRPLCEPGWGACDPTRPNDCPTHVVDDARNCGVCGNPCLSPQADKCADGQCVCGSDARICTGSEQCCAGIGCTVLSQGVPTTGGIARCGKCDAPLCPAPQGPGRATCALGKCGAECLTTADKTWADCSVAPGTTPLNCNVDLASDKNNCGTCGHVCPTHNHARAECSAGLCKSVCDDGFGDCNNDMSTDGCEIDLKKDLDHCGNCPVVCPSLPHITRACNAGMCNMACDAGWDDCDGNKTTNGCETDLKQDPNHCGTCPFSCPSLPHITRTCSAGACSTACDMGWGDCDGNKPLNGCETDLTQDVNHCGTCPVSCPAAAHATAACIGGMCGMTCQAGWGDCDNNKNTNGCETDLSTDARNCSACGKFCGPCVSPNVPVCASGQCACVCLMRPGDPDGVRHDCAQ